MGGIGIYTVLIPCPGRRIHERPLENLQHLEAEAEDHRQYRPHHSLEDLEGQLEERILRCAVDKGPPQGIAHDHDHRADRYRYSRRKCSFFLPHAVGDQRDHDRLQAMGTQGHEHGGGIKEKVA